MVKQVGVREHESCEIVDGPGGSQSSFNFLQYSHQFSLYCHAHVFCMLSSRRPFWRSILRWMRLYGKPCAKRWDVQLPLCQKERLLRKWNRQTRLRQDHHFHFHHEQWAAYRGWLNHIRNNGSNSSIKKTPQNCQGTQITGEVVSLWRKEERI